MTHFTLFIIQYFHNPIFVYQLLRDTPARFLRQLTKSRWQPWKLFQVSWPNKRNQMKCLLEDNLDWLTFPKPWWKMMRKRFMLTGTMRWCWKVERGWGRMPSISVVKPYGFTVTWHIFGTGNSKFMISFNCMPRALQSVVLCFYNHKPYIIG